MEIYENTALMWLERTRRAELVDLEVEKENSLEEKNLEMEEESNVEMEEVKKHTNEVSNKPDHLRMVGEDIEVEIGEGLHKKSDDKRLVSEGLNNEQNETMVLSLEVQCAIGKVRVMLNEAKEDLEVAVRRGNFVDAGRFQEQVRRIALKRYY